MSMYVYIYTHVYMEIYVYDVNVCTFLTYIRRDGERRREGDRVMEKNTVNC